MNDPLGTRRVVITASGMILPLGRSSSELQAAFATGMTQFRRAPSDQEVSISPVPDFDLKTYTGRFKNARYLSRGQQFALAAAILALDNAGSSPSNRGRHGLFLGLGPNLDARPRDNKALWLLDFLPNIAASTIAQVLGIHGENATILTACAASTQALGQAYHAIKNGLLDAALAGGGDSRLSPDAIRAYKNAGVLARGEPKHACRPFDQSRTGFAIGEGGAMFLLETLDHATARKAPILAEVLGAASTLDGSGMTMPDPSGSHAEIAVRGAMGTTATTPLLVAHGTGTALNDAMESELIHRVCPEAAGIVAFKSWTGHLAAACGGAELAMALACSQAGIFPEIRNLDCPCLSQLPFLRQATPLTPHAMVLQSFGFGGQNACLVVRPW